MIAYRQRPYNLWTKGQLKRLKFFLHSKRDTCPSVLSGFSSIVSMIFIFKSSFLFGLLIAAIKLKFLFSLGKTGCSDLSAVPGDSGRVSRHSQRQGGRVGAGQADHVDG